MRSVFGYKFEDARETFKNPTFYYILVPVVSMIWPIWTALVSLPSAAEGWAEEKSQYLNGEKVSSDILELDSDRLQLADVHSKTGRFNYPIAVDQIAKRCAIRDENYKLQTSVPTKIRGQQSQSASVTLKKINLEKFANFFSLIQLRWANLQCTQVVLTKQKGVPDLWKVDLKFKYYY